VPDEAKHQYVLLLRASSQSHTPAVVFRPFIQGGVDNYQLPLCI
jgi:hypothetical protein